MAELNGPEWLAAPPTPFSVLVGRLASEDDLWLDLAEPVGTLVQSTTRFGKSSLAMTLIGQAANHPSVIVGGIDPTGLLLGPLEGLPGGEYRSVGANALAHVKNTGALVEEMQRRIQTLVRSGTDHLSEFSKNQPLVLFPCEEWAGVLAASKAEDEAEGRRAAERLTPRLERNFLRLVSEGAKVGIRPLVLIQRAEAAIMTGYVRAQLLRRFSMRVDNAASVELLHEDADRDLVFAVRNFTPGFALFDAPGFDRQIVRLDHTDYPTYLSSVARARQTCLAARAEGDAAAPGLCMWRSLPEPPWPTP